MATAYHSIAAPVAASGELPIPANDTVTCWTQDPRAELLLASCATNPPAGTMHRQVYGVSADRWFAYDGHRVGALTAIREEIGERALAYYHEHGDAGYEPFRRFCRQPSVTEAIDLAISGAMETAIAAAVPVAFHATVDTGHGEHFCHFRAYPGEELSRLCEIDREARMANGRRSIVIVSISAER